METTLHRQLKRLYARGNDLTEVPVGEFRADATVGKLLIEIQCSRLIAIRHKLASLLDSGHHVLLVKPFAAETTVHYAPSGRRRTRRRARVDLFDDLVHLTRLFPHPRLVIDIVFTRQAEERRRAGHSRGTVLVDRRLLSVEQIVRLRHGPDLWQLLPTVPAGPYTTRWLADALQTSLWSAQTIAYCLRYCGAARATGRSGRFVQYEPVVRRAG